MDGVKRYRKLIGESPNSAWTEVVRASDYDAALAREAALREELASNVMTIQELAGANADLIQRCNALGEELAASRKNTEFAQESMQVFADEADSLQQRLTAAEQELKLTDGLLQASNQSYAEWRKRAEAAEQRNAETSASLQLATRLLASGLSALNPRAGLAKNVRAFLDSQRKPTESGASE